MYRLFALLLVVGLSLGMCRPVAAQEITGSVFGTVMDKSGAIVSGATVTIENADQNDTVIRVVTANDQGDFVAQFLPIGHYTIVAEAKGFKKAERRGVTLNVNDKLTLNFTLEPGAVTETVTVEADASPIELQTATASGLITGTEIRELAINTRNYEQLVALTPGVSTGLASDQLHVGVSSPTGLSNQINFSVYGRSSSGQINVITRSGTGAFHGGLYEFFRNDVLNANSFFNNQSRITRPP